MTLYHLQAFLILSVGATLFPADYTLGSLNSPVFETSLPSSTHQCSQADATCLRLVLTLHFQGPIFIQESICPVIYCCLTNDLNIWWLKNVLLFSELPGFCWAVFLLGVSHVIAVRCHWKDKAANKSHSCDWWLMIKSHKAGIWESSFTGGPSL